MIIDPAHCVLVHCLTEHTGCVVIGELLAGLGHVVQDLLVEELDEANRLREVFASCGTAKPAKFIREVKCAVGARRIELLRELPEELEPIGRAHLPELRRKADRELRHQQLVERVRLLVEVEAGVEVRSRRLSLLPEALDLRKVLAREVLGEDPRSSSGR